MDRNLLIEVLQQVHRIEGMLILNITSPQTADHDALQKEAHELNNLLVQTGLLSAVKTAAETSSDDLAQTLASMYDSPQADETDTCANVEERDDSDIVKPIISPVWISASEHKEVIPDTLTPPTPEEYYEEEDDTENVEIFEEEEEEDGEISDNTEGKHPDLSYITINERARFRNNLFDGDKKAFDRAMTLLQELNGYSEAANYFCNDLEWTPETNEVQAEFLEKIHECFRLAR